MNNLKRAMLGLSLGLMVGIAASCGASNVKGDPTTSTTSSTTTSTTIAVSLPPDQLTSQARGVITLAELGPGWSLDTYVAPSDLPPLQYGECNGPPIGNRYAAKIAGKAANFVSNPDSGPFFNETVFQFTDVAAASAAFQSTVNALGCGSWVANEIGGAPAVISALPDANIGEESLARRVTYSIPYKYCNGGVPFLFVDTIDTRIGAQVLRLEFSTKITKANSDARCNKAGAIPPDDAIFYSLATRAVDKFAKELQAYTEEFYAALSTTTTAPPSKTNGKRSP